MIDNSGLFRKLLDDGNIRIHDSPIFHEALTPLPPAFSFDRIKGMLLGVAIGDALGAPTEGLEAHDRYLKYGTVRDYIPYIQSAGRPVGVPTDDTQLTFWTLEQLIQDNGLMPDNLARSFCRHRITGLGSTVHEFIRNYKDRGKAWCVCGSDSLGNGALMRISPLLLPYLANPHISLYADTALDGMITHNSYASNAACVAFMYILWQLLGMAAVPQANWWHETYCRLAKEMEGEASYQPPALPGSYRGPLWKYVEMKVTDALKCDLTTAEVSRELSYGFDLFVTVPSVLYILARHSHNAEEAITRAVNDTVDNDSAGAIVGAAAGALHGLGGLPGKWIEGLTGRTHESDDGRVFKLILLANKKFWTKLGTD
ncbi:MAG: ADP-ribosylglycohydrolase family protein [Chloroflexi bacterium]|nr:ADP-ribosylglycohydrolase family protein [Chloroflexota bacterium]